LKQPNIFNGDHGLVGEGLQKGDLFVGEGTNYHSADVDDPDCQTFPQ
jgi:hypothetical protein